MMGSLKEIAIYDNTSLFRQSNIVTAIAFYLLVFNTNSIKIKKLAI